MNKQDKYINSVCLFGVICAVYSIIAGLGFVNFMVFLGISILILSSGLFFLRNNIIIRISTMLLAFFLMAGYFLLIVALIKNNFHYFWGVGLLFYFPIFIWSITTIIVLIKSKSSR